MTDDVISIVRKAYESYVTKDRAELEAIIADDFHFTSPLDNCINRQTYFDRCWKGGETIAGFNLVHLVRDGDRVFVTYEGRRVSGQSFRNTEILTVRDGKIVEFEVYFGWPIPHDAPAGGFVDPSRNR